MVVGDAPRRISVLGATGSVGTSTLDLVERAPDRFKVVALTANRNVDALVDAAKRTNAELAVIADPSLYEPLKAALAGSGVEAAAGPEALVEAAQRPSDLVMAAIVGAAGLPSTLAAAARGSIVAFANKECLVCAGPLMMELVDRSGATLLPVDSEHNAIFQALDKDRPEGVSKIILTASGGPFRTWSVEDMAEVTPEQALKHPTWDMGAKISIDSATMMNKGLEVIEAAFLFGLPSDRIEVLVHPQSVIHSMVEYVDGSVLAQLGTPDMRIPIAHTLAYPARMPTPCERLDLAQTATLTFEAPDPSRFPALRLTREALIAGGTAPAILNAVNEEAVAAFLSRGLGFRGIADLVERVLEEMGSNRVESLEHLYSVDAEARRRAQAGMAS